MGRTHVEGGELGFVSGRGPTAHSDLTWCDYASERSLRGRDEAV